MKQSTWYNCYDETLKAFITPESFAHPAKMAKRLTERIIEHGEIDMFSGQAVTKRTERKSFFRRLAESKGSPRIDYEEVIWVQKPGGAADRSQGVTIETTGAITSPPYSESNQDYKEGWKYIQNPDHPSFNQAADYGASEGQIGALKEGDFSQVICKGEE